jgi:creatinine amidohydrolase
MQSPTLLQWELLTKSAFDHIDRSDAAILVSCSPIEVHGPHLPMGADVLESEEIIKRMLGFFPERHKKRVFLKLPLLYVATDVLPQPGSLHFSSRTIRYVLQDLGSSLAAQGFRNVFVSSFHGGPRHFLSIEKACTNVSKRHRICMVSLFSLLLGQLTDQISEMGTFLGNLPGIDPDDVKGDTHAGFIETSNLLVSHEDYVEKSYNELPRSTLSDWLQSRGNHPIEDNGINPYRIDRLLKHFRATIQFFKETTYAGNPGEASAEKGQLILNALSEKAATAVSDLLDGALSVSNSHSPLWPYRLILLNPILSRLLDMVIGYKNQIG